MTDRLPAGVGLTALAVADARARESARPDRLFDDPFAQCFVDAAGAAFAPPAGDDTVDIRAARAEYVAVRTRFFDDALRDATVAGCRQVVLLAAGLDTRAFRLDWSAGTSLFELDVADVLAFKECVLAANGARPRCERIVVTADLREDWPAALRGAGFSSAQPSAWLAEGILMYLDEAERDALLSAIGALSASGSHLALELPVWRLSAEVGESMARGVVRRADFARVAAAAQSAPAGDADPSVADPGAWLAGHGWRPSIFAVAKRFAAYGRAAPALFSTLATSSPPRRLAIAHVA